jgi:5-methylcytosine-specific restriction endonuclease McrBC regulatory subunit McrC
MQIISKNLKRLQHPFYSAYTDLQQLCLQILRHESIKFGYEKNKVYGVLFDGAWLWEEYLATLLKEVDRMVHPKNRKRQDGIQIYKGGQSFFPDFYRKGVADDGIDSFVLDAKYKRLSRGLNSGELEENIKSGFSIQREDLFQMISYMHVLPAQTAALLYPIEGAEAPVIKEDKKVLYGLGGEIFGIGMPIPREADYKEFLMQMKDVENELKRIVNRLIE